MTNKVRSILASIFGWIGGLIVMLAFKDNTKKTLLVATQAICVSIVIIAWAIIAAILALIPVVRVIALILSPIVYIACSVFWIINIVKACQYDTTPSVEIPLFGKMATAIFGKIIEEKGLDYEPVDANGTTVDPNANMNPNMNAQPNPGPVNPTQPQQPPVQPNPGPVNPVQPQQPPVQPGPNPNDMNNMNQQ